MNDKRIKWSLQTWPMEKLKPYDKNPRIITESGLAELKRSFDEVGFAQPLNINVDGTILSGHARYHQLKSEGVKEVDVMVPDRKLTPKQEEAVVIRMNKNVAGKWDFDILCNQFEMEDLKEWGFKEIDFVPIDADLDQAGESDGVDPDDIKFDEEVNTSSFSSLIAREIFRVVNEAKDEGADEITSTKAVQDFILSFAYSVHWSMIENTSSKHNEEE